MIVKHRVVTLGFEPGLPWEFMFLNTSKKTVLASSITLSGKELSSTAWGSVYQFGNIFFLDLFLISDVAYLSCWVNSGFGACCFPRLCLRFTINRHFWENVSLSYLFPFFPSLYICGCFFKHSFIQETQRSWIALCPPACIAVQISNVKKKRKKMSNFLGHQMLQGLGFTVTTDTCYPPTWSRASRRVIDGPPASPDL